MACEGCCTFSDHKEINGLSDVTKAEEAIKFFAPYILPERIHLFGGEPTMHPQLIEWLRLAWRYWPLAEDGDPMPVWINTNGYFLDKLFDHVEEIFFDNSTFVSVTHHTLLEPYASLVTNHYQELQDRIIQVYQRRMPIYKWHWATDTPWDTEHKKYTCLRSSRGDQPIMLNMTFQHNDHFVPHYKGHGASLEPWNDYNHNQALYENHNVCHIKDYVQLYEEQLWKCPPRAVLNQTLETYNLQDTTTWADYYKNYNSLKMGVSEAEVDAWFQQQKTPENSCNMCGFMHSLDTLPAQQHLPKKLFKLKAN
jgi:hypothetical protein